MCSSKGRRLLKNIKIANLIVISREWAPNEFNPKPTTHGKFLWTKNVSPPNHTQQV